MGRRGLERALVALVVSAGCASTRVAAPVPVVPGRALDDPEGTRPAAVPKPPKAPGEATKPIATAEPTTPPPAEPADVERPVAFGPGGPALEITRRARTGVQPKSVTVSPDGTRLYVCNFGLANHRNVSVFDAQSLDPIGEIDFPGTAVEVAVSRDGATLYVSNFAKNRVEIVDARSLEVQASVPVDPNPKFMVVDESRHTLYVSNWSSRSVTAVDLERVEVARRLHTGRRPRGLALLADGTLLVGAMWDHRVQVYAPGSTRPDREFEACENPRHLMLSPDQERLYVSCSGDRVLRWFDPRTGEVLGEAPTGLNPRTIDVSGDGRYVAIADFSSSTVTVVDTVRMLHRTHVLARTNQIVGLAIAPGDELRVFATSWLTNQLLELQPATD